MSVKVKKIKFQSDLYLKVIYDDVNNTITFNNFYGNPLTIPVSGSGSVNIHDDSLTISNNKATLDNISNVLHTNNGNLNIINITFKFTANEMITDLNETYIKINGDFTLPSATFLIAYDITNSTPNQQLMLTNIGTNSFSLYGAQQNHTYAGTFTFSYIENGGNK